MTALLYGRLDTVEEFACVCSSGCHRSPILLELLRMLLTVTPSSTSVWQVLSFIGRVHSSLHLYCSHIFVIKCSLILLGAGKVATTRRTYMRTTGIHNLWWQ